MKRLTLKFKSTDYIYSLLNFKVDHILCIYIHICMSGNFTDLGN